MASLGSAAQNVTIAIIGQDMASPAFASAAGGLDALEHKSNAVGAAFGVMTGAAVAAGAAIAAGLGVGIKAASDLQQAVANISTIKPEIDTSQVFSALNEMSTRVPQSTKQLADGLYDIFSSMEVTQEQALKLVETFAKGATGAQTDAQTFGTAIVGVLNAYKLSAEDAGHVSDVFFNTINKGVVTGDQLARGLGTATASGKLFGATFEEVGALIVGVTKEGGDAAQNINNLTNLFNKLPTKEAAAGFGALGVSMTNADGSFRSTIDILGDLQAATADMTEEARAAAIQKIFPDAQARAGAVVIMSQLSAVRAALAENQSATGSTAAAYEKMSATFASQSILLKNSVLAAATTIGAAFLPALTRMATAAVEQFRIWQPTIQAFADQLPAAIDGAMTAFEEMRGTVASAFEVIGNTISEWLNLVQPAFILAAQLIESRLGPAFTVLSEQVMPAFAAVGQTVANAFTTYFLPAIGRLAIEIGTTLAGALDWFIATGGPGIATFITGTLVPALQAWYDWIGPRLQPAIEWLFQTALPGVVAAGAAFAQWFTGTAVPALQQFGAWLYPNLEAAWTWLTTTALPAIGLGVQTAATWIMDTAIPALTAFGEWLQPKLEEAWTWLTETALPAIVEAGAAVVTWILGPGVAAFTALRDWLQPKLEAAWTWLTTEAWPGIVSTGTAVLTWINGPFATAFGAVVEWLKPKIEASWTWLTTEAWPGIVSTGAAVIEWINGPFATAFGELAAWMQPKLEPAWTWLTGTAFKTIVETGQAVVTKIQEITTWIGNVGQALSSNQQFWTNLNEAWTALKTIGGEFVNDVLGPMDTGLKDSGTSASGFADSLTAVLGVIAPVVTFARQLADALNLVNRWAKEAGLAIRGFLQSIGVPLPDSSSLPGWIQPILPPTAPGSQSTDPGNPAYNPPGYYNPDNPVYGPPIPPGFTPGETAAPAAGAPAAGAPAAGAPAAPPAAGAAAPIDNSSRQSFARTAWPIFLQAAGGNRQLAEMMLAAAISENKTVGSGGPILGNSFYGIKAPGPSSATGQFTSGTWEQGQGATSAAFASFPDPVTGANAFMQFLRENPRYASSVAAYEQSGDAEALFRNINAAGYATDPIWGSKVANIRRNQIMPVTGDLPDVDVGAQAATAAGAATQQKPTAMFDATQAKIGNQWELGLPYDAAAAACGPAAAAIFYQATGRTPNAQEVMRIAALNGWKASTGMSTGPSGFMGMLGDLGVGAAVDYTPTAAELQSSVQGGNLTAISTGGGDVPLSSGHYFVAQGYNQDTGEYDLGETGGGPGNALKGGSRFMTLEQITAIAGPMNALITLTDKAALSFGTMSESVGQVNVAAAATTPQLANIGATIDPVVASFSVGATSVTGMTDAIIASAGASGVATESAAAYSQGLIGQDEALRGVLAGFAETTPAAATLLTQLDAGAISTDQAAVAFAGLATTTAEASGAITTTAGEIGTSVGTMATGAVASVDLMKAGTITAVDLMNTGVVTAAGLMSAGVLAAGDVMENGTLTSAGLMKAGTITAAELMNAGVVTEAQLMQADAALAADTMYKDVTTSAGDMNTEASTSADDMYRDVTTSAEDMHTDAALAAGELHTDVATAMGEAHTDAATAAGEMRTDVVTAAQTMATEGATAAGEFATDTAAELKKVDEPAKATATALEAIGDVEIPAPDVDDVIDAMKDVEKAAEKAADAVKDVGGKGGEKGGKDEDSPFGKAAGGLVAGANAYIVGERGPELFVPGMSGWIIPNDQLERLRATLLGSLTHRAGGGPVIGSGGGSRVTLGIDHGGNLSGDILGWWRPLTEAFDAVDTAVNETAESLLQFEIVARDTDDAMLDLTAASVDAVASTTDLAVAVGDLGKRADPMDDVLGDVTAGLDDLTKGLGTFALTVGDLLKLIEKPPSTPTPKPPTTPTPKPPTTPPPGEPAPGGPKPPPPPIHDEPAFGDPMLPMPVPSPIVRLSAVLGDDPFAGGPQPLPIDIGGHDDPGTGILYPGTPPGGTDWPEPPGWNGPVTPGGILYPGTPPGGTDWPGEPPLPTLPPLPPGYSLSPGLGIDYGGYMGPPGGEGHLGTRLEELLEQLKGAIERSGSAYNLTINTQASHESLEQDFAILEAVARSGG